MVIRGGAIGDFLVTLPALHLLRNAFPDSHLEILGSPSIIAIAENRFYSQASKPLESNALASFFSRNRPLSEELVTYFASFDLVISYLYDPEEIFADNLKKAGVKKLLLGPGKILPTSHATIQLATPLRHLSLFLKDSSLHIYPNTSDIEAASTLLSTPIPSLIIHPGSGDQRKNWPIENWIILISQIRANSPSLSIAIIGGECDRKPIESLLEYFKEDKLIRFFLDTPLPILGAILQKIGRFLGHDSGMGHLAAAAGCQCLLLFGPTDPQVWAPSNERVHLMQAPNGHLQELTTKDVYSKLRSLFAL